MGQLQTTKRAIASAMKEIMFQKPLANIKIADIVKLCGTNRQTFYYYFKDKYDLVNWIFEAEFEDDVKPINSNWLTIERMCNYFYTNRKFYQNALENNELSFITNFNEKIQPIILLVMENNLTTDNYDFNINFYSDAIRLTIYRWLLDGAKISPTKLIELIKKATTKVADINYVNELFYHF